MRVFFIQLRHIHEQNCTWMLAGSRHSHHSPNQCCCKGHALTFPHDESSKFLLLGGDGSPEAHDVVLFDDIPYGELLDHTPKYKSSIPSMHGQVRHQMYSRAVFLCIKFRRQSLIKSCVLVSVHRAQFGDVPDGEIAFGKLGHCVSRSPRNWEKFPGDLRRPLCAQSPDVS